MPEAPLSLHRVRNSVSESPLEVLRAERNLSVAASWPFLLYLTVEYHSRLYRITKIGLAAEQKGSSLPTMRETWTPFVQGPEDDWSEVTNGEDRKRIQNRLSQRARSKYCTLRVRGDRFMSWKVDHFHFLFTRSSSQSQAINAQNQLCNSRGCYFNGVSPRHNDFIQ